MLRIRDKSTAKKTHFLPFISLFHLFTTNSIEIVEYINMIKVILILIFQPYRDLEVGDN